MMIATNTRHETEEKRGRIKLFIRRHQFIMGGKGGRALQSNSSTTLYGFFVKGFALRDQHPDLVRSAEYRRKQHQVKVEGHRRRRRRSEAGVA